MAKQNTAKYNVESIYSESLRGGVLNGVDNCVDPDDADEQNIMLNLDQYECIENKSERKRNNTSNTGSIILSTILTPSNINPIHLSPGTSVAGSGIHETIETGTGAFGTIDTGIGIPGTLVTESLVPGTSVPGTSVPGTSVPGTSVPGLDHGNNRNHNNGISPDDEIDQGMLCQCIAADIIDNHRILGTYLCNKCGETIRGRASNQGNVTPDDVLYHVLRHYQSRNQYPCHMCDIVCHSDHDLEAHIFQEHVLALIAPQTPHHEPNVYQSDRELDDYESSDEESDGENDHRYRCIVCDRGYGNHASLGNHFMMRHNNYRDLNILDTKRANGFQGFDLLNKIKMIRFIRADEKINSDTCVICYEKYDHCVQNKMDLDMDRDPEHKNQKYRNESDDIKLLYLEAIDRAYKHPVLLLCCGANFCSECLKNHINARFGDPECPFCKKNHVQTNKRFIIFDERPKSKIEMNPDPYPLNTRTLSDDELSCCESDHEHEADDNNSHASEFDDEILSCESDNNSHASEFDDEILSCESDDDNHDHEADDNDSHVSELDDD
jgi:hypothetical protein